MHNAHFATLPTRIDKPKDSPSSTNTDIQPSSHSPTTPHRPRLRDPEQGVDCCPLPNRGQPPQHPPHHQTNIVHRISTASARRPRGLAIVRHRPHDQPRTIDKEHLVRTGGVGLLVSPRWSKRPGPAPQRAHRTAPAKRSVWHRHCWPARGSAEPAPTRWCWSGGSPVSPVACPQLLGRQTHSMTLQTSATQEAPPLQPPQSIVRHR